MKQYCLHPYISSQLTAAISTRAHRNPKLRGVKPYTSFCSKFEILFKIRVRRIVKSISGARDIVLTFIHFRRMESYFLRRLLLTDDLEIEDLRNDEKKIFSIFASRLKQLKIVSNIIKWKLSLRKICRSGNSSGTMCLVYKYNMTKRCLLAKECGKLCGYELVCTIPLDMKKILARSRRRDEIKGRNKGEDERGETILSFSNLRYYRDE